MDTRSTNPTGYVHYQGDVWSNVASSHGVALQGGSTGGIIQAVGDDANVSLSILAKGTGGISIGNSSNPVSISTGGTFQVGSTAPFAGHVRITSTMRTPDLSGSTDAGAGVSTVTAGGANSSHFVVVNTKNLSTAWAMGEAWVSSASEVKVKFAKASTAAAGASSLAVNILLFRF